MLGGTWNLAELELGCPVIGWSFLALTIIVSRDYNTFPVFTSSTVI